MQVNAPFPPPSRAHTDMSPSSTAGSEWSGMHNYNNSIGVPHNAPFGIPQRGDSMSPPGSNGSSEHRPFRAQTFGPQFSPTEPPGPLPPGPRSGSRASSRAGSIANSRSSDGTIADHQSRKYQRMEAELRQHYTVLRTYLKGGAAQPPRPNKARDKLLRLSPVQFHELSTDVFDELQRRQAAAPLPGRPPRDKVPPFLQPRREFHEKRNSARQKLSSLQTARFRDLSIDVFCELERRFPHFNPDGRRDSTRSQGRPPPPPAQNGFVPPPRSHSNNGSTSLGPNGFARRQDSMSPGEGGTGSNDYGRPMQKQFQSNTITPNKGTMIDDDEDDDHSALHGYARSSDAFGLESALASPRSGRDTSGTSLTGGSRDMRGDPAAEENHHKVLELEARLQRKEEEIKELAANDQLKVELEQQLEEVEKLNKSLQEELDRVQADHANMERDLRSQLTSARDGANGGDWRHKHEQLDHDHRNLKSRYEQQLRTTEEVSKQFKAQLNEMRALAESTNDSVEREEKLHHDVQRLEEELREWKSRYAKAKTQLRSIRTSTIGLNIPQPGIGSTAGAGFRSADGMVKDVHMTQFQISIDELLKVARSEETDIILESMRALIMAVRGITGDVDASPIQSKDEETSRKRVKLKNKVSATANNVITASKNYVAAGGLSPVSLLDAAVSHLTAAVIDLVRMVKIRPTPTNELEDHEDSHLTPVNNAGYFQTADNNRRKSTADSVYSALSDPPENGDRDDGARHDQNTSKMNGYPPSNGLGINSTQGLREDETELEELKVYLGNQTDILVQSVQGLVTSVRNDESIPIIRNHVSNIVDVVENVLGASEGGMDDPSSFQQALAQKIESSVNAVKASRDKLEKAGLDSQRHEGQSSAKQFTQGLPPMAFQLAREVRELVSRAESVEIGYSGEDDFS